MSELNFTGTDWYGAVVVKLGPLFPHPDPETTSLEYTMVFQVGDDASTGIPVFVKKGEFKEGDLAVYSGIDAIVHTANADGTPNARFGFLDSKGKDAKIKARKLRGHFSEGLLTPARALDEDEELAVFSGELAFEEGRDLTVFFGITKSLSAAEMEPVEIELHLRDSTYDYTRSASDLNALINSIHSVVRRPGTPGWTWVTKDIIRQSVFAGLCEVNGQMIGVARRPHEPASGTPGFWEFNVWHKDAKGVDFPVKRTIPWDIQEAVSHVIYADDLIKIKLFPQKLHIGKKGSSIPAANTESCPFSHKVPGYDLDALRKWGSTIFSTDEEVVAREKIHGAQFRAMHDGERLWVGTHHRWTKRPEDLIRDSWWFTAMKYGLEEKLKNFPGLVVFGEMFGQVQDLKYGAKEPTDLFLVLFDIFSLKDRIFFDDGTLRIFCDSIGVPMAPLAYEGPWNSEVIHSLRNGPSMWPGADHIREGVVVRPKYERIHPRLGRVVLKLVGEEYKLRK